MHFSTDVNDQKGDQNLGLRDVATGAIRSLQVIKPAGIESYPLRSAFSADGRQLAVEWYFDSDYRGRLWTVATAGTSPVRPRVLVDNPEIAAISPFDWSRDSRWIAVQVKRKDLSAQMGLVSVEDGSLRVLRSLDWIGATQMAFSRDGKFLAYDCPSAEGDIERDVFAIAVDGTREVPVVVHPGDDRLVGWSPDWQRLLFSSNRGGTVGLWAVTFTAESLPPTAEFLSEFGNSRAIGLTDSGTLYYKTLHGGADVFVAPFDAGSSRRRPHRRGRFVNSAGSTRCPNGRLMESIWPTSRSAIRWSRPQSPSSSARQRRVRSFASCGRSSVPRLPALVAGWPDIRGTRRRHEGTVRHREIRCGNR